MLIDEVSGEEMDWKTGLGIDEINNITPHTTIPIASKSLSDNMRAEITVFPTSETTSKDHLIFPISRLPPELRQKIYVYYFASHAPLQITDIILPYNHLKGVRELLPQTELHLASPFFIWDIPISIFIPSATFAFSSGIVLRAFAKSLSILASASLLTPLTNVRKLHIQYTSTTAAEQDKDQDWVFLIQDSFKELEELTFEVDDKVWDRIWWECVRDAVREGWCCGCVNEGKERGSCGRNGGRGGSEKLVLRVECQGTGVWGKEVLRRGGKV